MAPTDLSIKLHLYVLVHSTQQQDTRELSSVPPHPFVVSQLLSTWRESNINFGSASEAIKLLNRKPSRQMLYYPSRQIQQRTDNSLYNAIISTFKDMLEYPTTHFICLWNFQEQEWSLFLSGDLSLTPYMIKWLRSPENSRGWSNTCMRTTAEKNAGHSLNILHNAMK